MQKHAESYTAAKSLRKHNWMLLMPWLMVFHGNGLAPLA
jgi:hypothetical protein